MFSSLAILEISITYSPNIVGSLYVYAIDGVLYFLAISTTSSGVANSELVSSSLDLLVVQF